MRRRVVRLRAAAAIGTVAVVAGVFAGCGTKPALVGDGGECFLAADCQPGLICVDQGDRGRICTGDLSSVTGEPPSRPEEAGDGGDGGSDAEEAGDSTVPPQDAGEDVQEQDTGADVSADG